MDLRQIKGLGEVRIKKLSAAGIDSPLDLCCRFPTRYIVLCDVNRFEKFSAGDEVVGRGRAISVEKKVIRKGLRIVKIEFATPDGGRFWATWFNQPYIANAVKTDKDYYIIGKLAQRAGRVELSAPTLRDFDGSNSIIPVYKSAGLPSTVYREAVQTVLSQINIKSLLPDEIKQKFGLLGTYEAIKAAHFPDTLAEAKSARESLSLENLAAYIALFWNSKQKNEVNKPHKYSDCKSGCNADCKSDAKADCNPNHKSDCNRGILNPDVAKKLPFQLTDDQIAAALRIEQLLKDPRPANILIEGDVGCGKTVVCLLAMRFAADSGHQSVLMAPTEILARQHYAAALQYFAPDEVEFLSGSQTAAQKNTSKFNILHGGVKAVIGTHSVFTQDVEYRDLTLVMTDEQQRFGVLQRGALENKAVMPDCIVMSATPIPRTVALSLYGDLDLICLRQKPKKKASVFTRFVGERTAEMYDYIAGKAAAGQQTYIVCPRIDDDDELAGAATVYKQLKPKFGSQLGLLHGRMSEKEKSKVMEDFASGTVRVLVATTIIEVGIDVAAATTMVIYNAERYGLCQLHQLRGRIGRGSIDGYCFLLVGGNVQNDRLKVLAECDDGFELAERDFEMRGAGDFLGTRQHGKSLTFTGEPITLSLLTRAKEIAACLVSADLQSCDFAGLGDSVLYCKELTLN